jgi:hypothetical protein
LGKEDHAEGSRHVRAGFLEGEGGRSGTGQRRSGGLGQSWARERKMDSGWIGLLQVDRVQVRRERGSLLKN